MNVKIAPALLTITGIFGACLPLSGAPAAPAFGQTSYPTATPAKSVSRTTKAVNYRRGGPAAKIDFQGTELMGPASGVAKVQNKGSRVEIEAKFLGLDRKSTRLNSSHEWISYAVFCLKKKISASASITRVRL